MPRLGLGSVDLSVLGGTGQDVVTTIDDFFFESFSAGQMHPILTTSRTNLVLYSEDFTNGFINTGTTDTLSTTESSPTGSGFSTLLVGDSSGSTTKRIRNQVTPTASKAHTFSIFVKSNSRTNIQIINSGDAQGFANFDVVNGTVGTKGSKTTASIISEGNGWFRCIVTTNTSTTNGAFMIYLIDNNTSSFGASGSGTSGVFIWGAQLEQDGFVSNYIPTSGSAVTVSTTLNDTSNVWDFDGTDIMIAEDPEDEGFWEEGGNIITGFTNGSTHAFSTLTTSGTEITSAIVSSAFAGAVSNALTLSVGDVVTVVFNYTKTSGNDLRVVFSSSANGAGTQISNAVNISSSGLQSHDFTITATGTAYLQIGTGNSGHSINFAATGISANLYEITPLDI